MKKFYCQFRAVPKVLISVCVLLACSLLVTRVSEGQCRDGNSFFFFSFTPSSTTAKTYSNVGDGTVLITFTGNGKADADADIDADAARKDGVSIREADLPFRLDAGKKANTWELKASGSSMPEGTYIFNVRGYGGIPGCASLPQVSITVGPARVRQRSAPAPTSAPEATPAAETPPRIIVYQCPVGWQRGSLGQSTPKAYIQAVEVNIDRNRRAGLYKPVAVEIYVDPSEGLTDLAGWKLRVAVPYNHGRDYPLTAENAVVNEDGIVRVESPEADPFLMTDVRYIGRVLPGFDYRLFSEKNTRVDLALSCYKNTNATLKALEAMESPRVVRSVDLTGQKWDDILFFRSKWKVPVEDGAPAAPSLSNPQRRLATMWGSLKKQ